MKLRNIIMLLLVCFACVPACNALVECGPSSATLEPSRVALYGDVSGWDFFNGGDGGKFTQTCTLKEVRFYAHNTTYLTNLTFRIWRANTVTGHFTLRSTSRNYVSSVKDGLNVIDLSDWNCHVAAGDNWGFYAVGTLSDGNYHSPMFGVTYVDDYRYGYTCYVRLSDSLRLNSNDVDFVNMSTLGNNSPSFKFYTDDTISSIDGLADCGPYFSNLVPDRFALYGDQSGWYFFSGGQAGKFTQTGKLKQVQFYAYNTSYLTSFSFNVWREKPTAPGRFSVVSSSPEYVGSIHDGLNTIDLSSWNCQVTEGDNWGFFARGTLSDGNYHSPMFGVTDGDNAKVIYTCYARPSDSAMSDMSNVDFRNMSTIGENVPSFKFYMNSPDVIFHGDSIISGFPYSEAYITQFYGVMAAPPVYPFQPSKTLPYKFGALTGMTYQNMGISGQTFPGISDRFAVDVIAKHPKVVVIEGSINNLHMDYLSNAQIVGYIEGEITAAQAAGIVPVLILTLPAAGWVTPAENVRCNEINDALTEYHEKVNSAFILLDARNTMGYVNGANGWTLKSQYAADVVHPNEAGYALLASLIKSAIDGQSTTSPVIADPTKPVPVQTGATYTFYVPVNASQTGYLKVNGKTVGTFTGYTNYTFAEAGKSYTVQINVTSSGGVQTTVATFRFYTTRKIATVHIDKIDESNTQPLIDNISAMNATGVASAIPLPFTGLIGNVAYLILFSIPFMYMWLNTGRLTTPALFFLCIGWIVICFIPANYEYIIWLAISCAVGALIFGLIKNNRD